MPILTTDILLKVSTVAGSAGNSTTQTVPGQSLGKYMATTIMTDGVANNLFPDATGAENAASNVDYECFFIHNNNATLTYQNVVLWSSAEVAGGANMSFGVDTTAASAATNASAQALTVANKNTAPAGVTFTLASALTSPTASLSIGSLAAGQVKAVWVKRAQTNSAALNSDGATVNVTGDTSA